MLIAKDVVASGSKRLFASEMVKRCQKGLLPGVDLMYTCTHVERLGMSERQHLGKEAQGYFRKKAEHSQLRLSRCSSLAVWLGVSWAA
eukprot:s358_g12.t1